MNPTKLKSFIFVAAAGLLMMSLPSCLTEDVRSPQTVFEVADITVPADSAARYGTADGTVTAYIPVTCTESWSAAVQDEEQCPWIEIESVDRPNPSGAAATSKLKISCLYNDSYQQRSAVVRFTSALGVKKDVTVTQKAKSNRIAIDGETSTVLEADSESSVKFKVLSNTDWTVEIDTSSTLSVTSVSPKEGSGDDVVTIKTSQNYSLSEVVARLNLYVDGDTARVSVIRAASVPFIAVNPVNQHQYTMPSDTCGTLKFNCNTAWNARVVESNIENFALDTLAGEGGMDTELGFTMSANKGDESLTAKVCISRADDPGKNIELSVTHRAGFSIEVDFRYITDNASIPLQPADSVSLPIPFTEEAAKSLNNLNGYPYSYVFTSGGRKFIFEIQSSEFNAYGHWGDKAVSDGYFRINDGYIMYPAVEGYKLAYVELTTAATNKYYYIYADKEGTELVGAAQYLGKEVTASWNLENTEYGKSYYQMTKGGRTRQHNIKLLYVK